MGKTPIDCRYHRLCNFYRLFKGYVSRSQKVSPMAWKRYPPKPLAANGIRWVYKKRINPKITFFLLFLSRFLGFQTAVLWYGGRYWVRTSDPCRVKAVLYHWANRPCERCVLNHKSSKTQRYSSYTAWIIPNYSAYSANTSLAAKAMIMNSAHRSN